jgi:hypothetical protein
MPRNGSGTYTAPSNSANPAVPFTTISSTAHNAVLNDLVAALTDSLSRSGSGGMTAPLAMGANKITGLANGTAATDAINKGQADAAYQAVNSALTAFLALATTGHIVRTGAATYATRTITGSAGRVSVTNGDGVSGDPTIDWDGVQVRKNSTGSTFTRRRVNLIEGSNITLTVDDDAGDDEVDVTITAAGAGASLIPRGYLHGLTLSNNGTDPTNDIDIAIGECSSDATSPATMTLASAITKRLDAAWAVGTNQGGLDTGSKANSTWYHVWLIARSDTGVVDALFSTSATSPTMPANYDRKRRIGAVKTDGAGAILAFLQWGDKFVWAARVVDVNTTVGTTYTLFTLASVPSGVIVEPSIIVTASRGGATALAYLASSNVSAPATVNSTFGNYNMIAWAGTGASAGPLIVGTHLITNTSQQIYAVADAASTTIQIATTGWIDRRGRDS